MRLTFILCAWALFGTGTYCKAQLPQKLAVLWQQFETDEQLKYALAGICVLDAQTGTVIFEKNSNIGMAPASTQKVLTSIAAYEALGQNYRYQTRLGYNGKITGSQLNGNLILEGSGDPSFGSTRYPTTTPEYLTNEFREAIRQTGINSVKGKLLVTDKGFDINPLPDGWSWGDIGNYYGAGVYGLNWKENAYNIYFKTGLPGLPSEIAETAEGYDFLNEVRAGKKGTGDGSVIYAAPFSADLLVQGKLEPTENRFKVSGATLHPDLVASKDIEASLREVGIRFNSDSSAAVPFQYAKAKMAKPALQNVIYTHASPNLDSLVYWFMQKSINLYGEAILRTIGLSKYQEGTTEKGLRWVDSFYEANGFDTRAIHMTDGSGLSASNRITPFAMASALVYAKKQPWFGGFYAAFPSFNNMTLKSGTIHRTKCFAGYEGNYVVVVMANNFNGSASAVVKKMYGVLDILKKQ